MKITLLTVHRLGASPEASLARDYAARATATGRALGRQRLDASLAALGGGRAAPAHAKLTLSG